MFSVASKLPGQPQIEKSGQHGAITVLKKAPASPQVLSPPSFPHGSQILSLGRYLVNLSICEGSEHPCYDTLSGEQLSCKVYELGEFHSKAHLLLRDCWGVCSPHNVRVLDKVFVIHGRTYGDLHNFLKQKKKLPEAVAAPLFQQIVSLVIDAHRKDITLRDLKLKKFVFKDPERTILKLQNLEDAHLLDQGGWLSERHGCPAYVCPEMLQPGNYSGKAADMWSLGVILFTLLEGHYPFFDTNPQNLFAKIRSGYYHVSDHVSYLARSLISSLLAYEPHRRVSAEAALEHPWFVRAGDEPVPIPMPTLDQTVPTKLL